MTTYHTVNGYMIIRDETLKKWNRERLLHAENRPPHKYKRKREPRLNSRKRRKRRYWAMLKKINELESYVEM